MRMGQDFAPEDGQLCLPTHQVFEHPFTSHTPAVSLKYYGCSPFTCAYLCVPQIPLASGNMPPPSRDFSVPIRPQDPHYINTVSHGMVDNYSLPPDVSNFYL